MRLPFHQLQRIQPLITSTTVTGAADEDQHLHTWPQCAITAESEDGSIIIASGPEEPAGLQQ